MTPMIVGTLFLLGIFIAQQYLVAEACRRTEALFTRRLILCVLALAWFAMAVIKVMVIDRINPPVDGYWHELAAREIAADLSTGKWGDAFSRFGAGNRGYRFMLGVFYTITQAPYYVIYFINGTLAFWGLLSLLETSCRVMRAKSVPLWFILICCAPPSALYWSTGNLKEGIALWGIAMMLRLTMRFLPYCRQESLLLPLAGLMAIGFMRPHIAAAWLTGIGIGLAIRQGRISIAFFTALGVLAAAGVLQYLKPEMMQKFEEQGVVETMGDRYQKLNEMGGSAIQHGQWGPIPIFTGLKLIWLRPTPSEVPDIRSLLAGAEVWLMSALAIIGWLAHRQRWQLLGNPYVITACCSMLLLAFFFTYMYNMGLMVRQRIQVFPAMIIMIAAPTLYRTSLEPAKQKAVSKVRMFFRARTRRQQLVNSPRTIFPKKASS